jgi:hypothetical protein
MAVITALLAIILFGLGIWINDGRTSDGQTNFDLGIYAAILLLAIAIVLLLGGIIWDMTRNFRTGYKTLYIFGAILGIFILIMLFTPSDADGRLAQYWGPRFKISALVSKVISSGLIGAIIMVAVTIALIFYYEIKQTLNSSR